MIQLPRLREKKRPIHRMKQPRVKPIAESTQYHNAWTRAELLYQMGTEGRNRSDTANGHANLILRGENAPSSIARTNTEQRIKNTMPMASVGPQVSGKR